MLIAKGIRKAFGDLSILKGIDLEVSSGEVISIVGSSGAGKTTLLQILGTLESPDSGELSINGIEPFKLSSKQLSAFRNKHVGFIFQFHQLLPEFTAIENIILPALIAGKSMTESKKEASKLLEILGLTDRTNHRPSELSGGEQQRIAVARSLINKPEVVLADEPSGNLDSANSKELHQLFFDLRNEFGQTFIIVTHNNDLANMTDRKLVMSDGLILAQLLEMSKMSFEELKEYLDFKVEQYNTPAFIESDPIQLPHRFSKKEDIEIISFLVSTIAWGQRKSIIKSGERMLEIMEQEPFEFIQHYRSSPLSFVHRTFNNIDLDFFFRSLSNIYANGGLENAFSQHPEIEGVKGRIVHFREQFMSVEHENRSIKHLSNPLKNSATKRINMFLRWMVRNDNRGVDFGLWESISPSELMLPLDVHTSNNARDLKLLQRKQNDWKALEELMENLRKFDPNDPVKYDYALFGIGAFE